MMMQTATTRAITVVRLLIVLASGVAVLLRSSWNTQYYDDGTASVWIDKEIHQNEGKNDTHYTYAQEEKHGNNDPRPRNLRLAMVGDSLTRFQYLSLAAFLKHGTWVKSTDRPSVVDKLSYGRSWNGFYQYANSFLAPYEQCDCFRTNNAALENRYFADPERNNYAYMFLKQGSLDVIGHWKPADVHNPHNFSTSWVEPSWQLNWSSLIQDHIAQLEPKPDYLVFNAGAWKHDLHDVRVQKSIVQALHETNITGIYKTTTFAKNMLRRGNFSYERTLCDIMKHCFNISWTASVNASEYTDNVHFRGDTYARMNRELLELLASI